MTVTDLEHFLEYYTKYFNRSQMCTLMYLFSINFVIYRVINHRVEAFCD